MTNIKSDKDTLLMCAKLIATVITATKETDKKKLVEITGSMASSADEAQSYSPALKEAYRKVHNFMQILWREDIDRIISILREH